MLNTKLDFDIYKLADEIQIKMGKIKDELFADISLKQIVVKL